MKTNTIASTLLLLIGINAHTQGTFDIHGGFSLPSGDFRATPKLNVHLGKEPESGAGIGILFGMQYVQPISSKGLGIYGSLDISLNGTKKSYKNVHESEFSTSHTSGDYIGTLESVTYSRYFNIPLSVGLHYTHNLNNQHSNIYGSLGLVYNTLKISDNELKYTTAFEDPFYADQTKNITEANTFTRTSNIGFKLDLGIVAKEKYIFGLGLYRLGSHDFTYTNTYTEVDTDGSDASTDQYPKVKAISFISFKVGIILGGKGKSSTTE